LKKKTRTKTVPIQFDELQMYFNEPYVIDVPSAIGQVVLKQPTVGDIMRIGQEKFYSTLNIFITNTTDNRLMLWEKGVDWNKTEDYELFIGLYHGINQNVADLLFENIKFKDPDKEEDNGELFFLSKKPNDTEEFTLYSEEQGVEINKEVYDHIAQYFRKLFNIYPEEKFTKSKVAKEWLIEADIRKMNREKDKERKPYSLLPLISACVNHPGFKYKVEELKEVTMYQFMDSVNRLQIYESTTALMKGMYSGFISSKDIKADDYNFMKEIR